MSFFCFWNNISWVNNICYCSMCSNIVLIQLTVDWTGAKLSNILEYRTYTDILLLLLPYLASTTNLSCIPFGYFCHVLVQGCQGPLPCFLESYCWRSWWSRRQVFRRYHNSWCTHSLGGLFDHFPDNCPFHQSVFCGQIVKSPVLVLLSMSGRLSGL